MDDHGDRSMGARRREWAKRRRSLVLVTTLLVACTGTELATGPTHEEEVSVDNTLPPVGTVIAQDSIDIVLNPQLTGTNFVVGRQFTGSLPSGLASTAGRQLVLVVRDLSNPDVVCEPGLFNVTCASMVVIDGLGNPGRKPGRLSLSMSTGLATFFIRENFTLDLEPPGF